MTTDPRTATPSAIPSSYAVSDTADAAPARSAGAAPTTRSDVSVNADTCSDTDEHEPDDEQCRTAVDAQPDQQHRSHGRHRETCREHRARVPSPRTRRAGDHGRHDATWRYPAASADPASSGVAPSTNCRYCEPKNSTPASAKIDSRLVRTAVENAGLREQPQVDHRVRRGSAGVGRTTQPATSTDEPRSPPAAMLGPCTTDSLTA